MARPLLLSLLLFLVACSKDAGVRSAGAQPDDCDCTLQTALEEGVPGSPGHLIESQRNPNGESELAHLMRVFVDDLGDARRRAEAGQEMKPMYPVHRKMRCAWPTNPADRNEAYDVRAQGYLALVQEFDAAPSQRAYNAILDSCIACHQVSCSSVVDFIDTLRWR